MGDGGSGIQRRVSLGEPSGPFVPRVYSPPRHWPGTRTKKCRPLSRQTCPLPPAPLTAHSIRERKWVMPSPGGIIRVPEANFLLHDLGLERIWKQGWRDGAEPRNTNRLAERTVWALRILQSPTSGSCGIQTDGKKSSKEQMPPSRAS